MMSMIMFVLEVADDHPGFGQVRPVVPVEALPSQPRSTRITWRGTTLDSEWTYEWPVSNDSADRAAARHHGTLGRRTRLILTVALSFPSPLDFRR
jgi:hypothetical protein